MESFLGMSFDVFRETCFAQQGKFMDVVEMRHSERVSYFQKITGLKRAEELRTALQEKINHIPVYSFLDRDLKEAKKTVNETKDKLKKLKLKKRNASLKLKRICIDENWADMLGLPTYSEVEAKKSKCSSRFFEIQTILKQTNSAISKCTGSFKNDKLEEFTKEIFTEFNAILATERKQLLSNRKKLFSEVSEKILFIKDSELKNKNSNLIQLRLQCRLAESGICPTCAQSVKYPGDPKKFEEKITEIETEMFDLQEEIKNLKEGLKIKNRLIYLNSQIPSEFDLDRYMEYRQQVDLYLRNKEKIDGLNTKKALMEAELESIACRLTELSEIKYIEDVDKEKLIAKIDKREKINKELVQLETEIRLTEDYLKEKEIFLTKLLQDQKESIAYEKLRKNFERAKVLLHRDNLPRLVMGRILECLNERLTFYLDKFEVDFAVEIKENFEFLCDFYTTGDANKPAFLSLSGGQKVTLALAFRFALADVLGSSIPLLVLDEPTVHLDDASIESMCDVFKEVKKFAEKGISIFISTHDKELQRTFTRTIDLC
jgi:hypothetical protein